jgi:hypothetical protein
LKDSTSANDYGAIVARIVRMMAALALIGVVACWFWAGKRGALSFLTGSGVAALSFYLLHRLVRDLASAAAGAKVRGASLVLHAVRLLLLGGALFAIIRSYGVFVPALTAGLLIVVAAATLEALYELFYARA